MRLSGYRPDRSFPTSAGRGSRSAAVNLTDGRVIYRDPVSESEPTASRPRLAIAYDIGAAPPMELSAAIGDQCDLVWVTDLSDPRLGSMARILPRLGSVVDTDGRRTDEIVELVRAVGVDGVVAYSDSQLRLAGDIAMGLGLAGNPPEAVVCLTDKFAQRAAFAAAGLAVPAFVRVAPGTDAPTATAMAAELAFPVVVKPLQGHSSRDVSFVEDVEQLDELFAAVAAAAAAAAAEGVEADGFIVEEYLADRPSDGPPLRFYSSVEMVVQQGRPIPLALTGKFPIAAPFRETGNFMPHPLNATEAAEVLQLAVDAARSLGVQSGALHVEIKLTPQGPRLIEINGRVGGGAIDNIFTRRFGRSLTALAASVALGVPIDLVEETPDPTAGPFMYEFFVQPPKAATRLVSIGNVDRIAGTAGAETVTVRRSPGDVLDWRSGSQGYVMRVTGLAADLDELASVPSVVTEAASLVYEFD